MADFAEKLLSWYSIHKRDLPWRNTRDPYLIWISEIILQQTRVAQGLDYYLRFIDRFPTSAALAAAQEDEVLKYWQGLGYYSRARNLHIAAKSMNGLFPSTYKEVLALKGVGPYTAAAICSIAYGMPYAVVDGNVYRVLARVFAIRTPIDSTAGKKEFAELAQKLLDVQHSGDYNQALMDLGAMVCTPDCPQCTHCPLADRCQAYCLGITQQLPVKSQKGKVSARYFHYVYVQQGDGVWLHKRGAGDIWQNLYEPLLIESPSPTENWPLSSAFARLFGRRKPSLRVDKTKHVLSHRVIYADLSTLTLPPHHPVPKDILLVPQAQLHKYPVSRLVQILLEKAELL